MILWLYMRLMKASITHDVSPVSLRFARRDELRLGGSSDDEGVVPTIPSGLVSAPQTSDLDMLLMAEWEDRADQGLFRYDVTACQCKVVPGAYGFVAQLNEGRASKKRPTEFRIDQVLISLNAAIVILWVLVMDAPMHANQRCSRAAERGVVGAVLGRVASVH